MWKHQMPLFFLEILQKRLEAERNAGKWDISLRKKKHLEMSMRIRDGCNEGKNIEDENAWG